MREIEFMKTLGSHSHVLQMVGYLRTNEKTLLLLEYCADGDLLTLLREHRECVTLVHQLAVLFIRICRVLAYRNALSQRRAHVRPLE